MMRKTYTGSCHCGAVRFEADLDLSAGTVKCNCTFARKLRLWSVRAAPEAFRLIDGEAELTDYRGSNPVAHHLFCRHCGVHRLRVGGRAQHDRGQVSTTSASAVSTAPTSTS